MYKTWSILKNHNFANALESMHQFLLFKTTCWVIWEKRIFYVRSNYFYRYYRIIFVIFSCSSQAMKINLSFRTQFRCKVGSIMDWDRLFFILTRFTICVKYFVSFTLHYLLKCNISKWTHNIWRVFWNIFLGEFPCLHNILS